METRPGSLMARLSQVTDPRHRQGKRYPLQGLLGMLVLAAVHGEGSLRGMWLWVCARWDQVRDMFDMRRKTPPSYGALWTLLVRLDAEELGKALSSTGDEAEGISVDGKMLRGSKRATEPALRVVTAVGNHYRQVLAQLEVSGRDEIETTIALLHELPLAGKIASLDAGLLQRPVVKTIVAKRGAYIGPVKGNHGELHTAVSEWVEAHDGDRREPDHVQVDKGHGRLERRELWLVPAQELGDYLDQEFDWPAVRFCGLIRRYRRRLHEKNWTSVTTTLWIAGGHLPELSPRQAQAHLRQHWTIENAVFYVRDVSYDEDRLHGRQIGFSLSALRNGAINIIRQAGFRFIPDARRFLPARPDLGLPLLFEPPG